MRGLLNERRDHVRDHAQADPHVEAPGIEMKLALDHNMVPDRELPSPRWKARDRLTATAREGL
jgi:hypothetical protein